LPVQRRDRDAGLSRDDRKRIDKVVIVGHRYRRRIESLVVHVKLLQRPWLLLPVREG
jgi:hypothetical protein